MTIGADSALHRFIIHNISSLTFSLLLHFVLLMYLIIMNIFRGVAIGGLESAASSRHLTCQQICSQIWLVGKFAVYQ